MGSEPHTHIQIGNIRYITGRYKREKEKKQSPFVNSHDIGMKGLNVALSPDFQLYWFTLVTSLSCVRSRESATDFFLVFLAYFKQFL